MTWLLDTNTCIFLMKLREPVTQRVKKLGPDDLVVSSITCAELWFGAAKSQHPQRSRAAQDVTTGPEGYHFHRNHRCPGPGVKVAA